MTRPHALSKSVATLALLVLCVTGCAGPSASGGGETSLGGEVAPSDEAFECRPAETMSEEELGERERVPASDVQSVAAAEPAPRRPESPSPSAARAERDDEADLEDFYGTQAAGLGALGCALDASDCASAAQLGNEICRLADRVCDLDSHDARCAEAQSRCARARARISASCGSSS